MPLEIKITGDQAEAESILGRLHTSLANNAQTMPLDDLLAVTKARFDAAGFIVSVTGGFIISVPGPEDKPQPTTDERVAAIEKVLDETEAVAPKSKKRKTKDASPEPTATADPTPALSADATEGTEGDRAYVLDELTRRFTDPKQKTKAKAFIDQIVGRHGGVRLSKLDPDLFPAIRKEVDTWIAAQGGNGHAV